MSYRSELSPPAVGEPAPRFELPTDSGSSWSLDRHLDHPRDGRARPIVLVFHRHIH